MFNVEFSFEAENEYIQIWKYIAQDNLFYSIEVLNKIDSSITTICTYPMIWKDIGDNNRLIVEPKYRYKIIYTIFKDYIYIISIFKYKNLWE
jgi:plasmid stabilization system protein ParE